MQNFKNMFSYLPKSAAGFIGLLMAVLLPLQVFAAPEVRIEADLMVENNTTNTGYQDSVNAKVDEVITVQLWYHNMENEDSGKVADNIRANFDVPTEKGKNQTIKATIGGDNTNQITQEVNVNLSLENAYLEYIPGSAQWRHNDGTNDNVNYVTESISDGVVTNVNGVFIEDAQPCFNFEATITIQLRVRADVISVVKEVREKGQTAWSTQNNAEVGDTLEYQITVRNEGNTTLHNVVVGDDLPNYMEYVPGSTKLKNGTFPNGTVVQSDNLTKGGINIDHYAPGAAAYILFEARIMDDLAEECGIFTLRNKALVDSDETEEYFNLANTRVDVGVCDQEELEYACDMLDLTVLNRDKREVRATVSAEFTGDASVESYRIDFGDGTTVNQQTATHTYDEDGDYTAVGYVTFTANGQEETVSSADCRAQVSFDDEPFTPPTPELPVTGPAGLASLMLVSGGAAGFAHRAFRNRV